MGTHIAGLSSVIPGSPVFLKPPNAAPNAKDPWTVWGIVGISTQGPGGAVLIQVHTAAATPVTLPIQQINTVPCVDEEVYAAHLMRL